MGFLDKARTVAEQASSRAREGVEDVQAKRALGAAYGELGRIAFALVESGEIAHEQLTAAAEEVRVQKAKLDDGGDDAAPPTPASSSSVPPAMPV